VRVQGTVICALGPSPPQVRRRRACVTARPLCGGFIFRHEWASTWVSAGIHNLALVDANLAVTGTVIGCIFTLDPLALFGALSNLPKYDHQEPKHWSYDLVSLCLACTLSLSLSFMIYVRVSLWTHWAYPAQTQRAQLGGEQCRQLVCNSPQVE